jgi:hypothetical protein
LHTEFRDGNVPAGFEQLRVFKSALDCLPENVEKVKLRSDTAGYQHNLLTYCETGENDRFGRIEFAIGCDVTQAFKNALEYRYLAKRQVLEEQSSLPGMEEPEPSLPFPTMQMVEAKYKIFDIVTNIGYAEMNGEDLIHWLHERCGKSEEVHAVMKDDLAGGKLPSADFGENAAWWWIMILALNLNVMMKRLALDPSIEATRMKRIRFSIINIPGRIIKRSRELFLRLSKGHPSYGILVEARRRIAMFKGIWVP